MGHKRFRAAVTGEKFYSEMGRGGIQTLYFGRRPNLVRIYDKQAERRQEYRTLVRKLGKEAQPPTFESIYGVPDTAVVTRVERQIGGRVPLEIATLSRLFADGHKHEPFRALKIIDHAAGYERDTNDSFETYCTGMYLRGIAQCDGMHAVKEFISQHSRGNVGWAWRKYERFLSASACGSGFTGAQLQTRFVDSLTRQLAA